MLLGVGARVTAWFLAAHCLKKLLLRGVGAADGALSEARLGLSRELLLSATRRAC